MYNTIEVMILKIDRVGIDRMEKGCLSELAEDGLKHVKALPCFSVAQAVCGSYEFSVGTGAAESTGEGGFFVAPSGVQQTIVHRVNKESGKMTCRWVFIYARISDVYKPDEMFEFPAVIRAEDSADLSEIFDRMFSTDDPWENYGDCYKLMGCLIKRATAKRKNLNSGVTSVLSYISEHYTEKMTAAELARIAKTSESNLFATFKKHVGESPIAYINHYRMSVAAGRLAATEDSVCDIACSVGIDDSLYFSKLFKRTYGASPSEFRITYAKDKK